MTNRSMPDWLDWVVGYRLKTRRAKPLGSHLALPLVQRCPQHLSKWALQRADIRRTADNLRRMREAKARDDERLKENPMLGKGFIYVAEWN